MTQLSFSQQRWWAPEVIQSSAMDCGPAALKCVLAGFGVDVSYQRLREACQTQVDGTSIDTLEMLAGQLGLDAEQILLPVDHLLLAEAHALPAIVVVQLPSGFTHFVVLWYKIGQRFVQVMDPAHGRRWLPAAAFLRSVYRHTLRVAAADWRTWASSAEFLNVLRRRLRNLHLPNPVIDQWVAAALADEGWRSLATLDAATRLMTTLVQSGGLQRGQPAHQVLAALLSQVQTLTATDGAGVALLDLIPATYWSAQPAPVVDGVEQMVVRGAVLVRLRGRTPAAAETAAATLVPAVAAAFTESAIQPRWQWLHLLGRADLRLFLLLIPLLLLMALGLVAEALLLRALLLPDPLPTRLSHPTTWGLLLPLTALLLLLRLGVSRITFTLGRRLEMRLRQLLLVRLPHLRDEYFQSRPVSDMAQRSHLLHRLRLAPTLAADFLHATFTLLLITAGILWLSPTQWGWTLGGMLLLFTLPWLTQPLLAEQDFTVRSQSGALSRFHLDALLGLTPLRVHGAEPVVRQAHGELLHAWRQAAARLVNTGVFVEGGQLLVGYLVAVGLLFLHFTVTSNPVDQLLLIYWLLSLPPLAQELARVLRQLPTLRTLLLRLLEPLNVAAIAVPDAPEAAITPAFPEPAAALPAPVEAKGAAITWQGVTVVAAGHTVLANITCTIGVGEHVAIVGPSGAGKSSLVGTLLGWRQPITGRFLVDDQPLLEEHLTRLRRATAWVDPSVQLWNRSLLENLHYGAARADDQAVAQVLEQADLLALLERLPAGLQTPLGEGGGLLSGGEGQRVRLGRALLRSGVRLVILDEPFRGLDHSQRHTLLARTRRLWPDATLLCITHDVSETLAFERVLVLDGGQIIEDGVPAQLAADTATRYCAMLQAEEQLQRQLWADTTWRRLHLQDGVLHESTHQEKDERYAGNGITPDLVASDIGGIAPRPGTDARLVAAPVGTAVAPA